MRIFIDFDNTIVNTTKAYVDVYNRYFKSEQAYKYVNWQDLQKYNLRAFCPQDSDINIFETKQLFSQLFFLDQDTRETLEVLNDKFEVWICTIGTTKNINLKSNWIEQHLPFIKNKIYLESENKQDKSIVNMSDSFLLDDNLNCLDSSNANMKIVFGREVEYNKTERYKRIICWQDCYNYFNK